LAKTPWRKAYVLLALEKYTQSSMFKERVELLGLVYAIDQYVDRDYWYFHRQISFLEKIDIIIRPYTYLHNMRYMSVYTNIIKERKI
jgi:hypothetical protein